MEIDSIKMSINISKNFLRLIFIFTFLFRFNSFPQNNEPRFEHFSVNDGLPVNGITAILQDHLGYMWFGTSDGLSKYDGYNFINYRNEKENPKSISDDLIGCVYEDHLNNLWIGTQPYTARHDLNPKMGGLNLFNRKSGTFTRYLNNREDSNSINSNYIISLKEDDIENLWVGTYRGLNLFNKQLNKFHRVRFVDQRLTKETYNFLSTLENKNLLIQSITKVENNANVRKKFILNEKKIVMALIMGEETADYGWIENSKGKKVIEYEEGNNFYAGGRSDNRITIIIDTLEIGTYFLHYKSDIRYSYNHWITEDDKPFYPEWWGIQLFEMNDSLLKIFNNIKRNELFNITLSVKGIIQDIVTRKILIATNLGVFVFSSPRNDSERLNIVIKTSDRLKLGLGFSTNIYQSKNGIIWIWDSVNGLFSYNPLTKEINQLNNPIQMINSFSHTIAEDSDGIIWYGSLVAGLIKFDPEKNEFISYNYDDKDKYSLSGNAVGPVYIDRYGVLWVGTYSGGINKWDRKKWKFNSFLGSYPVLDIFKNKNNNIWLATNKGINIFNPSLKHFDTKYIDPVLFNKIKNTSVQSIIQDTFEDNIIWIGTSGKGLLKYDSQKQTIKDYEISFHNEYSSSEVGILNLSIGNDNDLWIGSTHGLFRLDKSTDQILKWKLDPKDSLALSGDIVSCVFKDNPNKLWIGSDTGGLFEYDKESKNIIPYTAFNNQNKLLFISELYEDRKNNFWIGTEDNGFYNYDRMNKRLIEIYSSKNGLFSNNINSIIEDENGNLWIGTKNGLSFFNIKLKNIRNYFIEDGLCSNYFVAGSKLKLKNGMLYFGTDAGLVYFHPDSIVMDSIPPQVVIQNISLFNRPDEKLEYEGFISDIKEITLPYNYNDLHFEYVGLHYGEPLRNQYKYTLEGFNKEWIDAGNLRTATYTNLDPGEYIFRVKASNRDGVWNEAGASLKVIINPPLWATIWAYLFYLILFGSLLYYIWRMQLRRVRVKHEYEMSRFEAQKLHEVDELKSRFFANISHEFRTPLTLILGPVKQIIERTKETKTKEDLNLVYRNANRLLGLVNQLLDISKIESGNMKLQTTPIDIIPYLKALVLSFTSYAERKRILLKFISDLNELTVYIDKDKFEKIINNVLSNAFKFTPDGGSIEVNAINDNENINIIISDTGVGIPKEKIQKIFDRFYQVDGSHTREQEGTGIGLSLTKELVELHKGKIEVESEEGKGSIFSISIPLGTDHLKPEEICELESDKLESYQFENTLVTSLENKINSVDTDTIMQPDKPLLLIVEDNYDVRNYIKDNLNSGFRIMEAVDGEDGWNKSVNNLPDLIVSDVMMPKMDGFELCKKLKTDERTSHIPVILLTAKAAKQDKIEGYELGADEYLMKPFEPDELRVRIKNLINQRIKLHEHFKNKGILEVDETKITSVDKKFLQKAFEIINQNISDTTFGVQALAELLNVSRSVLHRKIVSLTGESPGDLIRRIRLTKAANLIERKFGNISEISIEVGFSNPAQFSQSFQKQFGVTPSAYQQKITNS